MFKTASIRITGRLKSPVLLALFGLVVLAASLLYLSDHHRKSSRKYRELIVHSGPVCAKPMPDIQTRAPGGGWIGSLKTKFKNGMAYLAEKRGVDEEIIARFRKTDEERRAQLMDYFREQITRLDRANPILSPTDPLAQRVSRLVSPHRNELGDIPLSVKIYDSAGLKAFSSPDGSVRFDKGILMRLDDNEILALFGHELGHIVLAHKSTQTEWDDALNFYLLDISSKLKGSATEFLHNHLSKDQELKADEFSFDWALHHGYDLDAHHTLFGKLSDIKPAPGYPCIEDRAQRIQKRLIKHQNKKKWLRFFGG